MEFTPSDSVLFRASIEALKDFLPSAQIRCSAEGLQINGMDGGHIGFVDYFLAASDMAECNIPHPIVVGMSLTVLARVLANVGSGDKVSLALNSKQDKLVVSYTNDRISKKSVYEISLMNLNEDALDIPEMDYEADVQAKTSDVLTSLKEVGLFGEFIDLTLDEDGFHMSATGDMGSARQTLKNIEGREMTIGSDDPVTATFSAKFLLSIFKGGGALSPNTHIEFDATKPMRASFHYGKASRLIGYLAPRVTD